MYSIKSLFAFLLLSIIPVVLWYSITIDRMMGIRILLLQKLQFDTAVETSNFHFYFIKNHTEAMDTKLNASQQMENTRLGIVIANTSMHSSEDRTIDDIPNRLHNVSVQALPHTMGYILVVFYRQQLQSATNELFQLAIQAARMRMQIVEPLLNVSNFKLPSISNSYATITHLSDLYNLSDVNEHFAKCLGIDYPIIAPFEDFAAAAVTNSLGDAILLNLMKIQIDQWCYNEAETQVQIKASEQLINYHIARSRSETSTNKTAVFHVQISKAVCVNATGQVSIEGVFSSATNGVTPPSLFPPLLVLPEWRGIKYSPHWFYYFDPDYRYMETHCPIVKLEHSAAVMKEASHLRTHLNSSSPSLGIHIRFEWLRKSYNESAVKGCIGKLIAAAEALRDTHGVNLHNAIAIRDYSRLGTHTCGPCSRMAEKMGIDEQLQQLGIHIVEYNTTNTIAGASGESAFASFVEMEFISQANYLLVVGGGSFQNSIVSRFLANHHKTGHKRLSHMC